MEFIIPSSLRRPVHLHCIYAGEDFEAGLGEDLILPSSLRRLALSELNPKKWTTR